MSSHPLLSDVAGIVLAGGRSSRMGRPKALLPFDGAPLVLHVVNVLSELFVEVLVVAARGQELPQMAVRVIRDTVAFQGPARGLHDGLAAVTAPVAFVTSCDAASLNTALVAHLVARARSYDIVVPIWGGRPQPLHAVYRTSVLPLLAAQLTRGELRPAMLFDRVQTCRVQGDEIRRFDPAGASFCNINTPEEYAAALARCRVAEDQKVCPVAHA